MSRLPITSPVNPLLKEIRRVRQQGGLTEDGLLVAEGPHLVQEARRSGLRIATLVVSADVRSELWDWERRIEVPARVFDTLVGTESPQGVLALVEPPVYEPSELLRGVPLLVVLDGVQDPGNAGTIVRSAEAFGATGVVFGAGSAYPWNGKTLRASAGSLFRVPFLRHRSAMETLGWLRGGLVWRAGVPSAQGAAAAWDCDWRKAVALVIGSEGRGISEEFRERAEPVAIPTRGVESLNAGVAAGVLLYEAHRQRSAERESTMRLRVQ